MARPFLVLLAGMGLTACEVGLPEGRFACAVDDDCPGGWVCRADALCYATAAAGEPASEADGGQELGPDAGEELDAGEPPEPLPDAGKPDPQEDDAGEPPGPPALALLADLEPGAAGSYPGAPVEVAGTAYFSADGALWKSDGTRAGTLRIESFDSIHHLVALDGALLFAGSRNGVSGLYRSDGSTAGTGVILPLDEEHTLHANLVRLGDRLLVATEDSEAARPELWASDGTSQGTTKILDTFAVHGLCAGENVAYFVRDDFSWEKALWKTDGTAEGTELVASLSEVGLTIHEPLTIGDVLYFAADAGLSAVWLWRSDGTAEGTRKIYELPVTTGVTEMAALSGRVVIALHGESRGLLVSDGTTEGTERLRDGEVRSLAVLGERVYFASMRGLWSTDGTTDGTVLVRTFAEKLGALAEARGSLWMAADDGTGEEPWRLVPGAEPALLGEIGSGAASSKPYGFTPMGETVIFTADDGAHGYEPWIYRLRPE